MTRLPKDLGRIHFVGIGGIGMSGIAELLINQGYRCSGSDISDNQNTRRLRRQGAEIFNHHDGKHVENSAVVVFSSAIRRDNPEIQAAALAKIPVISRADMLLELMRMKRCISIAGTHGKSTTTSLIACILEHARIDPTVVIGGILNASDSNSRFGNSEWMVVETDESDGSFLQLQQQIGVVTNIDAEHLGFYGSFPRLQEAFIEFLRRVPFYGHGVICTDDLIIRRMQTQLDGKNLVSYGIEKAAMVNATEIKYDAGGSEYNLQLHPQLAPATAEDENINIRLPLIGHYNVLNSLAAIAVGLLLHIPIATIKAALADFRGVKRRFSYIGSVRGAKIIDDYAHHPRAIKAVIAAAKEIASRKVIIVFQPHRFTRLRDLFDDFVDCFTGADHLFVAPVYPASEPEIPGYDSQRLVAAIKSAGVSVSYFEQPEQLYPQLAATVSEQDYVIFMGAGSIVSWSQSFVSLSQHHQIAVKTSKSL